MCQSPDLEPAAMLQSITVWKCRGYAAEFTIGTPPMGDDAPTESPTNKNTSRRKTRPKH
jgi:hypothetical protein